VSAPRVGIVVLNWNKPEMTGRCIDHVLALRGVTFELLVIDNGSTPENRRRMEESCAGRCAFWPLTRNCGFAGGMNFGIRRAVNAGCDYVWLLNNDAFPDPDCLVELVRAMDAEADLGAATPRLTDETGEPQHIGSEFDWTGFRHRLLFDAVEDSPAHSLTGAALLVRTSALAAVGEFDPRFFAYWEDVDLCYRLKRGGYRLRVVDTATAVHLEGASAGATSWGAYLYVRNTWLLVRKHRPPLQLFSAWCLYASRYLWSIPWQGRGTRDTSRATIAGLWHAAVGRFGKPGRNQAPQWFESALRTHSHLFAVWLIRLSVYSDRLTELIRRSIRLPRGVSPRISARVPGALAEGGV
jgi:GT2 family glycosyltransferase